MMSMNIAADTQPTIYLNKGSYSYLKDPTFYLINNFYPVIGIKSDISFSEYIFKVNLIHNTLKVTNLNNLPHQELLWIPIDKITVEAVPIINYYNYNDFDEQKNPQNPKNTLYISPLSTLDTKGDSILKYIESNPYLKHELILKKQYSVNQIINIKNHLMIIISASNFTFGSPNTYHGSPLITNYYNTHKAVHTAEYSNIMKYIADGTEQDIWSSKYFIITKIIIDVNNEQLLLYDRNTLITYIDEIEKIKKDITKDIDKSKLSQFSQF